MDGPKRSAARFSSKVFTVFLIAITCVSLFPTIAADSDSGTTTVLSGHYMALPIDTSVVIEISYAIDVINGPNIDVILTDSTGYSQYTSYSSSFQYMPQGSRLNTRHASASMEVDSGRWYLIIDNTNAGSAIPSGQSAVVEYSVSTSLAGFSTGDGQFISVETLMVLGAIVVIIVVAIVVVYVASKKKRDRYVPPVQYQNVCPGCGRQAKPDALFCEGCGRRLK